MSWIIDYGLKALAAAIAAAVDGAVPAADVKFVSAGYHDEENLPHVVVISDAKRWKLVPSEQIEVGCDPSPSTSVLEIGSWQGKITIQVGHKTPAQRKELERKVWAVFHSKSASGELRRGLAILTTDPLTIDGIPTTYMAPFSVALAGTAWREERAAAEKRLSWLEVDIALPDLSLDTEAFTIDELVLEMTQDMSTPPPTTFDDVVHVTDTGDIAP